MSVNTGTRNKGRLMDEAESLVHSFLPGTYENVALKLGYHLKLSTRCAKENYLDQLIAVGVVKREREALSWVETPPDPSLWRIKDPLMCKNCGFNQAGEHTLNDCADTGCKNIEANIGGEIQK